MMDTDMNYFTKRHLPRFIGRNLELINKNSQANYYGSVIAYRWLAVRLEFLSHTLVLIAAIIFVLVKVFKWK